jgi:hypothetical protein
MTADHAATRQSPPSSDSRDQSADGDGSDATVYGKGSPFQAASPEPLLGRSDLSTSTRLCMRP